MKLKKMLALFLAIVITLSLNPCLFVAEAVVVISADGRMRWEMPKNHSAFDIYGDGKQTTYADMGYGAILWVDGVEDKNYSGMESGVPKSHNVNSDISLTITATHRSWTNPNINIEIPYVEIEYTVSNAGMDDVSIDLAGHADVQIGNDDDAPLEKIIADDGTREGLLMIERDFGTGGDPSTLLFTCGGDYYDNPITVPVDSLWIGHFLQRTLPANIKSDSVVDHIPNPSNIKFDGTDTGMAYSWIDKTVPAGGELKLKVYFSVTPASEALFYRVNFDNNCAPGDPPAAQKVINGGMAVEPIDDGS